MPTGRIDELLLQPGDTVTFASQGGGGYGDPFARDPALVESDVRRGLVSDASAREEYGVALRDGRVDAAATGVLRSRRPLRQTAYASARSARPSRLCGPTRCSSP